MMIVATSTGLETTLDVATVLLFDRIVEYAYDFGDAERNQAACNALDNGEDTADELVGKPRLTIEWSTAFVKWTVATALFEEWL